MEEVPHRHDVPARVRQPLALYPNFPDQTMQLLHQPHGARRAHQRQAKENKLKHDKTDFEVPLVADDFSPLLPQRKMPPASKLPVVNLFNH
jgi:hypothetical protein